MTKGCYKVGEGPTTPPRRDTSYRSFICILLIFLLICLIILLASINWGSGKNRPNGESTYGNSPQTRDKDSEDLEGRKPVRNKTHEKIRFYQETSTEEKVERTTKGDHIEDIPDIYEEYPEEEYTTKRRVEDGQRTEKSVFLEKLEPKVSSTTKSEERISTSAPEVTIDDTRITTDSDDEAFTIAVKEPTPTNSSRILLPVRVESTTEENAATDDIFSSTEISNEETSRPTVVSSVNELDIATTEDSSETTAKTEKVKALTSSTPKVIKITTPSSTSTSTPTEESSSESESITESAKTEADIATTEDSSETTTKTEKVKALTTSTPKVIKITAPSSTSTSTTTEESSSESESITESAKTEAVETLTTTSTPKTSKVTQTSATSTSTTEISISESESITENEEAEKVEPLATTSTPHVINATSTMSTTTTTEISNVTSTTTTTEISLSESESFTETISSKKSPIAYTSRPVCESPICKKASSRMLSMMNHSAGPCDDFYEFACGYSYQLEEETQEYTDKLVLGKQLSSIEDSSDSFSRNFKDFYQSCLKHEKFFGYRKRMEGLESLLEEVGHFQFNISVEINLTDLVSSLVLRQSMPLFDIGLDLDKQSSNLILQLNLPHQSFLRTGIEDWSGLLLVKNRCLEDQKSQIHGSHVNLTVIYDRFQECQRDYSSYLDSVEAVVRELNAFSQLEPKQLFKEIKELRMTIEFQILNKLNSLPPSAEILGDFINKNYDVRRISDLQIHFPILDWGTLFQSLTGHQVPQSSLVQVYFTEYFRNMFKDLGRVDKRKLNNALLAIHAHDLFINTVVPKKKSTRYSFCIDLSKKLLPDIWSHLVRKSFSVQEQEAENVRAKNLFLNLRERFCKSLLSSEWIEEDTKVAIMSKCNSLEVIFFEPPEVTSLTENYKDFNVTGNYQLDLINALKNFKRGIFSTVGSPVSSTVVFSYFLDPLSAKPLTFYASPKIAVPLGLLRRSPNGLPRYMLDVRAGFALARQLTRHFDATGMTYKIKLKSTSRASYSELVNTMTTLMDYSSPRLFQHKNITFQLNGSLSINERIVDNTAFRLSFDNMNSVADETRLAWIGEEYSREKVFYIATAQELCKKTSMLDFMLQVFEKRHLPAVLRVENIVGNSQQFASDFGCPKGSGMDFSEKLQFPYIETFEEEDLQQNEYEN